MLYCTRFNVNLIGAVKAPPSGPPVIQQSAAPAAGVPPASVAEPPRDPNGKFTDKEILEVIVQFELNLTDLTPNLGFSSIRPGS